MREAGESWSLTQKFQEVLFCHQGEFAHAELYHVAKSGTEHVVKDFLDEIGACLHYLIGLEVRGVTDQYRLEQLKRIGRVYGRSALLRSPETPTSSERAPRRSSTWRASTCRPRCCAKPLRPPTP